MFRLTVFSFFFFACAVASARPPGYVIRNVSVIPMHRDGLLPNQTVVIRGEKIKQIGAANSVKTPNGYTVIDGTGKFLLPGFFDMHTHFMYEQGLPLEHAYYEVRLMLANGVTTARIMNGSTGYRKVKTAISEGGAKGPELFMTSPQFVGKWPWKNDTVSPKRIVTNAAEAASAVKQYKQEGYDAIKIAQFIDAATYQGIVEAAKKEGIKVTGHVGPQVKLPAALAAGQQVEHMDEFIEMLLPDTALQRGAVSVSDIHIWYPQHWKTVDYLQEEKIPQLAARVKQSGIYVTPTNYFFVQNFGTGQTEEEIKASPDFAYLPQQLIEERFATRKHYTEDVAQPLQRRQRWIDLRKKLAYELNKADVPLMCGSDAPAWFMMAGFAVHNEIENMVDCGLTPYDALKTATITPATYLGIAERTGTVQKGKEADLILLDANPLENIRNIRTINAVFANGVMYDTSGIKTLLTK